MLRLMGARSSADYTILYNSIMHGDSRQGGDNMVSMMTVVQQDPLYNASPEMSELTGGPVVTPMPPLPKLPSMSLDDILSLVHEEEEADENDGDAVAEFFDCNTKEDDDDSKKDNNDTDDDDTDEDDIDDDMDDGGGDSD